MNRLDLGVDPASRTNGATGHESDLGTDSGIDLESDLSAPGIDSGIDPRPAPAPEAGLTISDAAALLGIHANTIRRRIRKGRLAAALAPGPAGQEYRLTNATVEALRRELASGGRAPQLRPDPVEAPPAPGSSGSDSESVIRSDPRSDPESVIRSDPERALEHERQSGALSEQNHGGAPPADAPPGAPGAVPAVVAALEAAHRAELRRVEELVTVLRDELEVRRQEQADEREAHRREVEQLHTLLAQSHQLALPRPSPAPEAVEAVPAREDDGGGVDPVPEASGGWWRRALSWLRG